MEFYEKSFWKMYAYKDKSYYGKRRQYSGGYSLEDFQELAHWFLNKGFVVVYERHVHRIPKG